MGAGRRLLIAFAIVTAAGTYVPAIAQEMPVKIESLQAQELFVEARRAFHGAWFERADQLFGELIRIAPEEPLFHGYAAVADRLLYRDTADRVRKARELSRGSEASHRRMVDALVLYAEGEYAAAEAALEDVVTAFPDDPYARHRLGSIRTSLKRPAEAVETLRALVRDRPEYAGGWNHLGYAYLALDRKEEALESFRRFLALSPGNPSAHDSYADGLARTGDVHAAIGHLARAVLLEPNFAYGWMHMGDLLREIGATIEAGAAYDRAAATSVLYGQRFRDALDKRRAELQKRIDDEVR